MENDYVTKLECDCKSGKCLIETKSGYKYELISAVLEIKSHDIESNSSDQFRSEYNEMHELLIRGKPYEPRFDMKLEIFSDKFTVIKKSNE